jgi:hypothetical protein
MPDAPSPLLIDAGWVNGNIEIDRPIETLRSYVRGAQIVILKNALPRNELRSLRQAVYEWGRDTPEGTGSVRGNNDLRSRHLSWHGHLSWPPDQRPPLRLWHGYAFSLGITHDPADAPILSRVRWMFDAMRDLHQRLTDLRNRYELGSPDGALRPQIMHYPSGGGARAWEQHSGDPTVISQIAALSERGIDFSCGGNMFKTDDGIVDTSEHHDLGDICLFRSDLWHAVTPVDPEAKLNLRSGQGRWTAVLPVVISN